MFLMGLPLEQAMRMEKLWAIYLEKYRVPPNRGGQITATLTDTNYRLHPYSKADWRYLAWLNSSCHLVLFCYTVYLTGMKKWFVVYTDCFQKFYDIMGGIIFYQYIGEPNIHFEKE